MSHHVRCTYASKLSILSTLPLLDLAFFETDLRSQNSDVYIGYVGWGAGSFDSTYGMCGNRASKMMLIM